MVKFKLNQNQIEEISKIEDPYKKRDLIQDIGIDFFKESSFNLICTWATSVGKTVYACKIFRKIRERHDKVIHVCVPYQNLKEQWEKTLNDFQITNVKVFIINTYSKLNWETEELPFLLCVDEASYQISNPETKSSIINDYPIKYKLYLSATLKKDQLKYLESKGLKYEFELTLKEASMLDLVPPFYIYNVFVDLTEEEKKRYKEAYEKFDFFMDYFRSFNYKNLPKEIPYIPGEDNTKVASYFYQVQGNRSKYMAVISNAANKINVIKKIRPLLENRKTIYFSKTAKVAGVIAKLNDMAVYHSKQTTAAGNFNLTSFLNGDKTEISSVLKLIAGFDDKSSDTIVRHSFDSTKQAGVQSLGK